MRRERLDLRFDQLAQAYAADSIAPSDVIEEVYGRVEASQMAGQNAWLAVRPLAELLADVRALPARKTAGQPLPLFGLPFGVKDSIDVAGLPTTVGCPALSRVPAESAPVVKRLVDAGAIVVGKTNMDQLASGLVGVRSPYGVPANPFSARMIPGGSSSGSAVVVAAGHVSFALGTDTAGSGRVPAAFNNVVGLKPTRGVVSMRGVAPACRSVDCFSVFTLTVGDACAVVEVARGYDEHDPFSRTEVAGLPLSPKPPPRPWRIGVPRAAQREFFGDREAEATFDASIARFKSLGCVLVDVDLTPFRQAGDLLYGGPWVAERLVLGGTLLAERPDAFLPVIREILSEGRRYDALATFKAMYRLATLRQETLPVWRQIEALLVPSTPTIFSIQEVLANPRELNTKLGIYTTFANLLDLTAFAIPAGFRRDGLPAGITLLGPKGADASIAAIAEAHHRELGGRVGATEHELVSSAPVAPPPDGRLRVAVVGAHLQGQPLNGQLTSAGATLVRSARTAPLYRLYELPETTPAKPGLVREANGGHAIEVEIWALDAAAFGHFVSGVKAPLCIGTIDLEDGSHVPGFLCEAHAVARAKDISAWGGWRAYLRSPTAL
jgi:allophanate hydrolase